MTYSCIKSVQKYVPYPKIIVIDNSNTFRMESVTVIKGKQDWSFAHSCNVGADNCDDDIILLNNDTIALCDFVTPMANIAGNNIGIVGALLTYRNGRVQHAGSNYNHGNPIHPDKNKPLRGGVLVTKEVEAVTFACAYITRECWNLLGGLDEEAFPFGYEDVDFCLRARKAGRKIYLCAEARLVHLEHITQKQHRSEIKQLSDISLQNLRKRWGK
jgi:GT2 family glycosyltransferase